MNHASLVLVEGLKVTEMIKVILDPDGFHMSMLLVFLMMYQFWDIGSIPVID